MSVKKIFFLLCLAIVVPLFACMLWPVQKQSFSDIPIMSEQAITDIKNSHDKIDLHFLSMDVNDQALPHDRKTGTWYSPALTESIHILCPFTWHAARTEKASAPENACTILLYNQNAYIEFRLVETGLPLISVNLSRVNLSAFVPFEPIQAKFQLLHEAEDGSLQTKTEYIKIKQRGYSSTAFPKDSYTLFFDTDSSSTPAAQILDFPITRKLALNSLYEDDSKIRDVLAYKLWEQVEPNNAIHFEYVELVIDNSYRGLYGLHELPTETTIPYEDGDVIYKINSYLDLDPSEYSGNPLPNYEIYVGDPLYTSPFDQFIQQFASDVSRYPDAFDKENFVNNAVFKEVIASEDTFLQNMFVTFHAKDGSYTLTPWDLDLSFGNIYDAFSSTLSSKHFSLTTMRHLAPVSNQIRLLSILYNRHPDFAKAVAARYRELRQSTFTDEAMLEQAAAFYDQITACGARQRDAERWPNSAISEDNSFIETFIPARMAFLDSVFGVE